MDSRSRGTALAQAEDTESVNEIVAGIEKKKKHQKFGKGKWTEMFSPLGHCDTVRQSEEWRRV